MELLIARNPDPDSTLPFLLRLPLGPAGQVLRTSGTWPREKALFCYPVPVSEWPEEPEIVERVAVRSCTRRGAAVDLVLDRGRENRSQVVWTRARGREMVFWQSARTRKQARPNVRTPTARAAGIDELEIVVDTRERYAYKFPTQQVKLVKRALPVGDYAVAEQDGRSMAVVERKSLQDLVSSLQNGTLRFRLTELATVPRAAVVVEDRWSQVFKLEYARPAVVADGLAELQVRWPTIPILFCETRQLAEEWTYRFLAAASSWAEDEAAAEERIGGTQSSPPETPSTSAVAGRVEAGVPRKVSSPTTGGGAAADPAAIRSWARRTGLEVSDRGRVPLAVRIAFEQAHAGSGQAPAEAEHAPAEAGQAPAEVGQAPAGEGVGERR